MSSKNSVCYQCQFSYVLSNLEQSLTKPPSDYPDKNRLAHVQVALRMQSRGHHVQPGDVIPYVMCKVCVILCTTQGVVLIHGS